MIAAGIDIGSNTFRLLIADTENGTIRPLARELVSVRLGKGLSTGNLIEPAAMERGLAALALFRSLIDRFAPQTIRACGTEALRKAANRASFLTQAETVLGAPIEIISGLEEARLNRAGIRSAIHCQEPMLVVDAGGGSTELAVAGTLNREEIIFSLPLGAVSLSEKYPESSPTFLPDMTAAIEETLRPALEKIPPGLLLVGSGGTATSLAALDLKMTIYDSARVQGHCLPDSRLTRLCEYLASLAVEKRCLLPLLGANRGDIILAGARIYQVLLARTRSPHLMISDSGLIEGIVLSSAGAV